jgi:hypothetical protein
MGNVWRSVSKTDCKRSFAAVVYMGFDLAEVVDLCLVCMCITKTHGCPSTGQAFLRFAASPEPTNARDLTYFVLSDGLSLSYISIFSFFSLKFLCFMHYA